MKVLILNPILYTPGYKGAPVHKLPGIKHTMIYNFALGFRELGHEATIVASEEYRPTKHEEYEVEIVFLENVAKKLFPGWPNGFPILSGLWSLLRQRRNEFDMIIVSELLTQQAVAASLLAPEKTIIWQEMFHHAPNMREIPSKIWHNTVIRLLVGNRVKVVGRSPAARDFAAQYCRRISGQTIDHGVNLDNFTFVTEKKKQFVSVAQFRPVKNLGAIIENFARFIAKYDSEYRLMMAGDGEMRQELEELAERLGVKDKVTFCGFLSHAELSRIVGESQASLIHTHRDLNMVSIPETLACGTPILTNTVPLLAGYIAESGMGIAKGDWNEDDMQEMVLRNAEMVENCRRHREELSNTFRARKMMDIMFNEA